MGRRSMRCDRAPAGDRCGRRARSMLRCGSGRACGCGSAHGCNRARIRRHRAARSDRPSGTIRRGYGRKQNARHAARRTPARSHPRPRPAAGWPCRLRRRTGWRPLRGLARRAARSSSTLRSTMSTWRATSSRPVSKHFVAIPVGCARRVAMMRSRSQPAARMAAMARNNISLRSAPGGAPSRISSIISSDRSSRSSPSAPGAPAPALRRRARPSARRHRRDVGERPVDAVRRR